MTQPPHNPYGHDPRYPAPDVYGPQPGLHGGPPQHYGQPVHPYGEPPHQHAQSLQPGQQPGQPPQGGWPPASHPPRKRQRDAEPGRFIWGDLIAVLVYVIVMLVGGVSLLALLPPFSTMLGSGVEQQEQQALFLINVIGYAVMVVIALALSAKALWRSVRAFGYLWWLKLLLVPVAWVVTLILTALLVLSLGGEPETSENQLAIESMLAFVPFLAAVLVMGLLGPYVEEYFFRHLLIGKLSRYINIWICGAISVITFPLLHFIPALVAMLASPGAATDLTVVSVVPYVVMGSVFTVAYILTGRSLVYAWLLHAFNNVMALVMAYFVQPQLEQFLEDSGIDDLGGLVWHTGAVLRVLTETTLALAGGK
ncbi:CPBP family glutamic-type intramembrane protease [Nesterenkonia sp. LB17]|uniref:CPBP family glutamic-type intramembrane protease n=1 Tax=unclassified Nesterenkonia TaxID=2629769 RepID=UPI001F4CEAC6|nr:MULTISPECIES: CPBP family glutamic-type intramembrane protease [unclassified Nesterenkonia]MCH8563569.1 CPBP family glutamic-type intramembrane protease [Nesterenkonia sp. YGD6]MCH8566219.1 CPBP family glutamic-type intramembrane protease [Nesterenkonia sp. LB17]